MQKGKLFYLIGASGAGKDTLLLSIKEWASDNKIVIAHRYVYRQGNENKLYENQISLSKTEFEFRARQELFAMQWHAHNASYGIGSEIELWMDQGLNVVVNGSRSYVSQMQRLFPKAQVIAVSIDDDVLLERLRVRNREAPEQLKERVERNRRLAEAFPNDALLIDNSGSLRHSRKQLQQALAARV